MPPHFRLARRPRAVAMSDDLLAVIGADGLAAGLRFVANPADPSRASIVYSVQGQDDFELLEGPLGPVWASFDASAARFRRDFADGRSHRLLRGACMGLSLVLALMVGIWLALPPHRHGGARTHETYESAGSPWEM